MVQVSPETLGRLRTVVAVLRAVWTAAATEPPCTGHHWHLERRGWACCHCPRRVRRGQDAPVGDARCAQPVAPFDELEKWLGGLTTPPRRRRRLGAGG